MSTRPMHPPFGHAMGGRPVFLGFVVTAWLAGCSGGGGTTGDAAPIAAVPAEEEFPGGDTTSSLASQLAFSRPLANLDLTTADSFFIGDSLFDVSWITAPSSVVNRDGLGPLFNARSCSACHPMDGRGRPPLVPGEDPLSLLFRLGHPVAAADGGPLADSSYGGQLQPFGILGVDGEATPRIDHVPVSGSYPDGTSFELAAPVYSTDGSHYGAFDSQTTIGARVAPAIFGLGLLAAIDEADLIDATDPNDLDGDGVRGRVNIVPDLATGGMAIGRFGWKAGQPNLRQQAAAAFVNDIGITSSLFPNEAVSSSQAAIIDVAAHSGGAPELDDVSLDHMDFYMHAVAPPKRRDFLKPSIVRGRASFLSVGCAACHTPRHVTGTLPGIPEVSGQTIFPYTDLLLHDMGPDLAEGPIVYEAAAQDWRTPPLWGLGLIDVVNGHDRLLHDGRARGVEEAILWHGGEATSAREGFMNLTATERAELIEFVEDL